MPDTPTTTDVDPDVTTADALMAAATTALAGADNATPDASGDYTTGVVDVDLATDDDDETPDAMNERHDVVVRVGLLDDDDDDGELDADDEPTTDIVSPIETLQELGPVQGVYWLADVLDAAASFYDAVCDVMPDNVPEMKALMNTVATWAITQRSETDALVSLAATKVAALAARLEAEDQAAVDAAEQS